MMFTKKSSAIMGLTLSVGILAATAAFASPADDSAISPLSNISKPGYAHTNILIARKVGSSVVSLALPGSESPISLRSVYHIPSTAKGGDAIAIVDAYDDPVALHDFNAYAKAGGFPLETSTNATASTNKVFQVVYANGTKPGVDPGGPLGWDLEESLDFEASHGTAPKAKIYLIEAASNSFADLIQGVQVAYKLKGVKEVSLSWGGGDGNGEQAYDKDFKPKGITVFASSGDTGAEVGYPSASPYVVSVGGTTVNRIAGKFSSESGWSGSGGGPSSVELKPAFQNGISLIGKFRGTPDISADADPNSGIGVYDSNAISTGYVWYQVGGTSLACPLIASYTNLAATYKTNSTAENTTIYKALGTSKLRDITTGYSGYSAGKGYDYVTGVGVPNGLGAL